MAIAQIKRNKKGIGITIDAIIALMFIMVIFLAMSSYRYMGRSSTTTESFKNLHYTAEDVLEVLNKQGVLDTIGEEWTAHNDSGAIAIINQNLENIVPKNMGYRVLFDGEMITENQRVNEDDAIAMTHSTRLLAGYEKNKTTVGSVARAFLSGISDKTSSAYAYFGGFVGQGNISRELYVPMRVTINDAYIELNAGDSFDLYVNGQACLNPHSPGAETMGANIEEDISSCAFTTGSNLIEIDFRSHEHQNWYIGGGFVKVTYNTSVMNETGVESTGRYYFPGINGYVNHFSSIYVPGALQSMNVYLHLFNNYSTFFNIGNTPVYVGDGNASEQTISLDNAYLDGLLSYSQLSDKTTPIRLGANISVYIEGGNADVILITDVSGSMMTGIGEQSGTGTSRECEDAQLLDSDTRKISLAKCLDEQFVEMILNSTGNRVGLISFDSSIEDYHSLSSDESSLLDHIDDYPDAPSGGTCICCAINRAYNMLNSESSPDRRKFIVVMSDGITGYCCGTSGWWWWSSCDSQGTSTSGQYNDCSGNWGDCTGGGCDGAIDNAIWSAGRVNDAFNVTINSVGFGPVASCVNGYYTLQQIADEGGGQYCASDDAAELRNCYLNFARGILNATMHSQILNVSGNPSRSLVYPDSYIEYNYNPTVDRLGYGEITMSYDTERFDDTVNCDGSFLIPEGVEVIDAKVTSYSAGNWTDYVHVQNSVGTRVVYRLSDFSEDYDELGDPYIVDIPADYLVVGENNTVKILTGIGPDNSTGCSADNRAILTVKLSGSVAYGGVFTNSEGCNWEWEFEDGSTTSGPVPSDYSGANICSYTSSSTEYVSDDSINDAIHRLMAKLDSDDDGMIDLVKFESSQVYLEFGNVGGVRSLWGPAQIKLILWQ